MKFNKNIIKANLSCKYIETRESCRVFDDKKCVLPETLYKLLYSASLAPSGKNTQPWRFRIIEAENIKKIAALLPNNKWLFNVNQIIAFYLNKSAGYDFEKDIMAMGACIQNILIEAEANRLGACWVGECTEYRREINEILCVDEKYTLMAFVAIGHRIRKTAKSGRQPVEKLLV